MIDVRLLERNKERTKVSFLVKGVPISYANSLRRIMTNKVPTLAIEYVEFRKNNTALYDEIIAHRLGLIPLKTDLKSYNLPSECKCEGKGCAQCQLKLTLQAKGPKTVYSGDLKSKDPKVVPVYDKMPIVKLVKNQDIELEATAVMGIGKEHIKWCPGLVHYKNKVNITIEKEPNNAEEIAKRCPVAIFEVKNNKLKINQDNVLKCILCDECMEVSKGAVKVEKTDDLIFFIESWGQLTYGQIIKSATGRVEDKLNEFVEKVKKLE